MISKTYEDGYLDGLTHTQAEHERLRAEIDHAIRVCAQTAQVLQQDREQERAHSAAPASTYQDGYLDGLIRSQSEIERLRGEFDHMFRVVEQMARVMQQDRERDRASAMEKEMRTVAFMMPPVALDRQQPRMTG